MWRNILKNYTANTIAIVNYNNPGNSYNSHNGMLLLRIRKGDDDVSSHVRERSLLSPWPLHRRLITVLAHIPAIQKTGNNLKPLSLSPSETELARNHKFLSNLSTKLWVSIQRVWELILEEINRTPFVFLVWLLFDRILKTTKRVYNFGNRCIHTVNTARPWVRSGSAFIKFAYHPFATLGCLSQKEEKKSRLWRLVLNVKLRTFGREFVTTTRTPRGKGRESRSVPHTILIMWTRRDAGVRLLWPRAQ